MFEPFSGLPPVGMKVKNIACAKCGENFVKTKVCVDAKCPNSPENDEVALFDNSLEKLPKKNKIKEKK